MPLRTVELIYCREIRSGFHFHIGVAFTVNDIEHVSILQEGAEHRNGFLIVQNGAIVEIWRNVGGGEGVVKEIGVARVFVVDHVWQDNIAADAIQAGCFSHDVDSEDIAAVFSNFREQVVSGKSKRIVDIQDDRIALL